MQRIIVDEPYEFVPPHRGTIWPHLLKPLLVRNLRKQYGIVGYECRNGERLRASLDAGHGVLVAANHCRPSDPLALVALSDATRSLFYIVASWHIFKQSRLTRFLVRRMGGFSIYREGMDRASMSCSIRILETAERPLVIFPEGHVSRSNDQLHSLMEGTAFIARSAARKRQATGGKVVVHPLAMRYHFDGDLDATLKPVLEEIEARLSWQKQDQLPLFERIAKLGRALLRLKEIEYVGETLSGSLFERSEQLMEEILRPIEEEWVKARRDGTFPARVKRLRAAILKDMVHGEIPEAEQDRRWRQFADLYLVQQISLFPETYLYDGASPERYLETVERFEEALHEVARPHPPLRVVLDVCEAIEVDPEHDRKADADPLMVRLEEELRASLASSAPTAP